MAKKIKEFQDYSQLSLSELTEIRRMMAERVNRQMRRWEAAGLKDKASAYTHYARPFLRKYGEARSRFTTTRTSLPGKTVYRQRQAELAEINAMQRLMLAPTYTITGYRKAKTKALEGLARFAGIEKGSDEYERFLESVGNDIVGTDQWRWVKTTLGSDVIAAIAKGIAAGTATKEEMLDRIKTMQMREIAGRNYAELSWEDYIDELGLLSRSNDSPEEGDE